MEATVKRTTYDIYGSKEPCFEVTNGYSMVRIAPLYHYAGKTTTILTEYLDGEFNSQDEFDFEWKMIDEYEAIEIAKTYSVYLR